MMSLFAKFPEVSDKIAKTYKMNPATGVYEIDAAIAIDPHKGWMSANRYPIYADSSYFVTPSG